MIYICIPTHDEERTIGVLLWKIRQVMAEFERDYKILVLDDASGDDTRDVLNRYRSILPLSVFEEESRTGYTQALEKLVRVACKRAPYPKRDAVVTLQGDFTESPEHIVPLIKTLEGGADVVAGVLNEGDGGPPLGIRAVRRLAPWLLGSTHRDAPVSDPLCGYRAYRVVSLRKALREAEPGPLLTRQGWACNVELLGKVSRHARRIEEVPLDMRYDMRRRGSRFQTLLTMRELFRLRGRVSWPGEEGAV